MPRLWCCTMPTNARSSTGSIQNHVPAMPKQLNVPFETESPAAAASITTWKSMPQPVPGAIVFNGSGLTQRVGRTLRRASEALHQTRGVAVEQNERTEPPTRVGGGDGGFHRIAGDPPP